MNNNMLIGDLVELCIQLNQEEKALEELELATMKQMDEIEKKKKNISLLQDFILLKGKKIASGVENG